jgi:predicted flap endonuclease-1-like 5' DNA nuclease
MSTPLLSKRAGDSQSEIFNGSGIYKKEQNDSASENIQNIEGIGVVYSERLNAVYIYSVRDLLEAGKTREGRIDLAEKTGISIKLILKWVNQSDLFRVDGVGTDYAQLLESAGVNTVVDLSRRNSRNLYTKLVQTNNEKNLVREVPTREVVEKWIQEAKNLPRKISY